MRKTFLRTLLVAGALWAVACGDDSTPLPTVPAFDHIPGREEAFADLQAQIMALFPSRGRGGGVQNAALRRLRNIDRQLSRSLNAAQGMAFGLGQFGLGQLNAGNLQGEDPAGDLGDLIDLLSFYVGQAEGGFALQLVDDDEDTTVLTEDGHASVIIESEDLTETILVSIQEIVEDLCLLETDLVQAAGCWRFNRFPPGNFDNDVEVTICVDDDGISEGLLPLLRIHKVTPGQVVQALVATDGDFAVDCTEFGPLSSLGSNGLLNFASAVSGRLRALLNPQPLFASTMSPGPRSLGGLTGSFTDFGGAVPGILIYGPSMLGPSTFRPDNEQTFAEAEGFTVTVADATEWGALTTAEFASFKAIVFGDRESDVAVLGAAEANKADWSAAITGPMIIGGLNPQIHQCDILFNAFCIAGGPPAHQPEAVTLIKNSINFAASGLETGLYASLSRYFQSAATDTPVSFLSAIGPFKVVGLTAGRDFNEVTINEPLHPVMDGLSNAGLSGWGASIHAFLEDFPGTFITVATGGAAGDALEPLPVIIATPVP